MAAAQLRSDHHAAWTRQFRTPQHEISTPRPPYGREGVGGRSEEAGVFPTGSEFFSLQIGNFDSISKPSSVGLDTCQIALELYLA